MRSSERKSTKRKRSAEPNDYPNHSYERGGNENAEWSPLAKVYDPLKIGSIDGTDTEPHDHGIVRAMGANYYPNKNIKGVPERTVFVGSLAENTTKRSIEDVMSKFGKLVSCELVLDLVTGASKRYAFVEYRHRANAENAVFNRRSIKIDNKNVIVDLELGRTLHGWIPRRLGGGFGGKKESGQLRFGGRYRPFKKPYSLYTSSDLKSLQGRALDVCNKIDTYNS